MTIKSLAETLHEVNTLFFASLFGLIMSTLGLVVVLTLLVMKLIEALLDLTADHINRIWK